MANPKSLENVHSANPASQLNVPREDGDSLGVDGAQVGIREQEHKERLGSLVETFK